MAMRRWVCLAAVLASACSTMDERDDLLLRENRPPPFRLHVVGKEANDDHRAVCRRAMQDAGVTPQADAPIRVTLSFGDGANKLQIAAGERVVLNLPRSEWWTDPLLCRDAVVQLIKLAQLPNSPLASALAAAPVASAAPATADAPSAAPASAPAA